MVSINSDNRMDIVRSYSHEILDHMDWDTLYTFAYEKLVEEKENMDIKDLENEILEFYPHILED